MKVKYLKISTLITIIFSTLFLTGCNERLLTMIPIPDQNYSISQTEITQQQYKKVMKYNPSHFTDSNNLPVENVSWYDAIVFCNNLSIMENLTPVYSVFGTTNPKLWNYNPGKGEKIKDTIIVNDMANGYRLPKKWEWIYAAKGGEPYKYPGSNTLNEVAWYSANSDGHSHEVATRKPNGYGLYDMAGNILEWVWDANNIGNQKIHMGGCWNYSSMYAACTYDLIFYYADYKCSWIGFRVVKIKD